MRTIEPIKHINRDERGVAWIDDTNVKVIEVVMDWMANGSSAEEMQRQHPHLALAQIHAAMAFYYDHKAEVDSQIQNSLRFAEEVQGKAANQITRRELLARLGNE
jgi:uncharacterized protein (DUF433 family)